MPPPKHQYNLVLDNIKIRKEFKMKTKKTVFYLIALLLAGCLPSLHPLYNDKTLIFREELIGKWMDDDGGCWQFGRGGEKEYKLRLFEEKEELGRFSAHLIEIEGLMFLDIFPDGDELEKMSDFYKIHLLPVHTFLKVDRINPNLQLRMVDYEKIENMLENDPNILKHEILEDRIILTAGTEELQHFVIEHVESIFGETPDDSSGAIRLEPLYTEKDVVFDPNLIGQWKSKDGGVLTSKSTDKKTYELTFVDRDGTKREFFTNLIRHRNEQFMAVFADKAELEPDKSSAYAFHLIPDRFFRIEKTESELILQKTDYKQVLQLLRNNIPSSMIQPMDNSWLFKGSFINQ
jgi:hypothetical protein